jgi:hypothetical protein
MIFIEDTSVSQVFEVPLHLQLLTITVNYDSKFMPRMKFCLSFNEIIKIKAVWAFPEESFYNDGTFDFGYE